jgi:hypothetical protein
MPPVRGSHSRGPKRRCCSEVQAETHPDCIVGRVKVGDRIVRGLAARESLSPSHHPTNTTTAAHAATSAGTPAWSFFQPGAVQGQGDRQQKQRQETRTKGTALVVANFIRMSTPPRPLPERPDS